VSSDPLGVGIYPLVSQCNHSCDSNCCYWVEDGKIVLAAERPIKQNSEITYSYIKEVYQPKSLRQKVLCNYDRNWNSGGSSVPVYVVLTQARPQGLSSVTVAADWWIWTEVNSAVKAVGRGKSLQGWLRKSRKIGNTRKWTARTIW
jgi:hypothetical protein